MMYKFTSQCKRYLFALVSVMWFSCFTSSAQAEAPMVKTQAPGYYRTMVGQFEVTALSDGFIDLEPKLMQNASAADIHGLLASMFRDTAKVQTSLSAYLINTGSKLVLVDAGAGKVFDPTLGNVPQNLKASGYDPAQVDAIMITHMHGDHIEGLSGADGKPLYPNAVIYVAKAESDFWLSTAEAEKAPASSKEYFKIAHDLADPYVALGKWKTFGIGEEPIPGIKAMLIPGHTPGHTAFEVYSGGESLLLTGDLVHFMSVQFSRPDISVDFDWDQKQAVLTRQALFKSAAKSKALIAGMHLPFPGIGRIRADGNITYTWVPVEYSPIRK